MEHGFCVACEPLAHENERANFVRPPKGRTNEHLLPIQEGESGDLEAESEKDGCGAEIEAVQLEQQEEYWSNIADRVEEFHTRVAEQFEIENDQRIQQPPMIKVPIQPTREQWERHQTTNILRALEPTLCGSQGSEEKPLQQENEGTYCTRCRPQ